MSIEAADTHNRGGWLSFLNPRSWFGGENYTAGTLGLNTLPNTLVGQMKKMIPGPFNDERHCVGIGIEVVDLKASQTVNLNFTPLLKLLERFIVRRNKCKVVFLGLQSSREKKEVNVKLPTLFTAQLQITIELNLTTEDNVSSDSHNAQRLVQDQKGDFASNWLDAVCNARPSDQDEVDLLLGHITLSDLEVLREVNTTIRKIIDLQTHTRLCRIIMRCFKNPERDGVAKYEQVEIIRGLTSANPNNNTSEYDFLILLLSMYDRFQSKKITDVPLMWVDGITFYTRRYRTDNEAIVASMVMEKVLDANGSGQIRCKVPDTSALASLIEEEAGAVHVLGTGGKILDETQGHPTNQLEERRQQALLLAKSVGQKTDGD